MTRVLSAAVTAALAAAAGMAFQRVFAWQALAPVVAVAAVLPTVLSLALSARGRRPLWQPLVLTAVVWLLVASGTLFRGGAGGPLPIGATVAALRDSAKGILTTILPAPGRPELLVLVHALVWAAAFAGAELSLRSRSALAPAAPAAVVLVAALLLGVDGPGSSLPLVVLVAGLSGLLALVRGGSFGVRALSLGLPVVASLALAAGVVGPSLPLVQSRPPLDLRDYVTPPPPDAHDDVSPLDEVSAWLQAPDTPLFAVRAKSAQDWRLVVLDRFDGTTWTPSATFVPSGSRVPRPPTGAAAPASSAIDQQVTIQTLTGAWLPAAARPAAVTGVGAYVDPVSGMLMAAGPLRSGTRYDVVSAVPSLSARELEAAVAATDAEARADLALPGAVTSGSAVPEPAEMQRYALQAAAGAGSPFQQAAQLADYLRANEVYDVTAPPGHSYRTLEFFLTTSHRGTSEQFATTYALMARALGLPSRIAVGFRSGVPAGSTWQVRGGDALVWPEVDFKGVGWVPFYPTPDQAGATRQTQTVAAGESPARQAIDQQIAAVTPPPARPPRTSAQAAPREAAGLPWWAVGPALAALGLAGYAALVETVPRGRRRRRRRRPTPAGRVVGAWQEAVEELRWLGLPPARALSAHDVASFGVAAIGGPAGGHLRPLADAVNQAGFAGEPPDEAVADAAWHHSDTVRRMVEGAMRRGSRLRRRLDPRRVFS